VNAEIMMKTPKSKPVNFFIIYDCDIKGTKSKKRIIGLARQTDSRIHWIGSAKDVKSRVLYRLTNTFPQRKIDLTSNWRIISSPLPLRPEKESLTPKSSPEAETLQTHKAF